MDTGQKKRPFTFSSNKTHAQPNCVPIVKKRLYLEELTENHKVSSAKEALRCLAPYGIIYAQVKKATFTNSNLHVHFIDIDLPVPENDLLTILRRGVWTGDTIEIRNYYMGYFDYEPTIVVFDEGFEIDIRDLYVYEEHIITFLEEHPDIFTEGKPDKTTDPVSTGSKKDIVRINATRKACEVVIEELYQEKDIFENNTTNWEPKLLSDTGKTIKKLFMGAVQYRLDKKLHKDTAEEAWKRIPADFKLRGRRRDQ